MSAYPILLVLAATTLVYIAERQQEANVVDMILQKRGVELTSKEIRYLLSSSGLHRSSTISLALALLVLMVLLSGFEPRDPFLTTGAIFLLMGLGGMACVLRVFSLFRVIAEATRRHSANTLSN